MTDATLETMDRALIQWDGPLGLPRFNAIAADDSVSCVVLAGAGRAFCAGHDLGSIAEHERAPSKHFEPETVDALESLPQPTIARIQGHCCVLSHQLGCDGIVLASFQIHLFGLLPLDILASKA